MSTTFPEIRDTSTISPRFFSDQFLGVGIEGVMNAAGDADLMTAYEISDPSVAATAFGDSALTDLVVFLLGRGLNSVWAVASDDAASPALADRQEAWAALNESPDVRILLTDSVTQADLVALADTAEDAELIQHKQFCVVGLATPSSKANLTAAATAIASKRAVLVGPGIYDGTGTLVDGTYQAAYTAAEIAKNPDITDDMDLMPIPGTSGIEQDTNGLPLFRQRVASGTVTNDFVDMLDDGVSPFMQDRNGQAAFVHLRTTWVTDDTFDALQTLLIKDQVFIGLKEMLEGQRFLRRPNTPDNRALAGQLTETWLTGHRDWVEPITLPSGDVGYGVTVTPSNDYKRITIEYQGVIVRNNQKIDINGVLTIPV